MSSKQDNISITEKMAAFLTRDHLEAWFLAALAKVPDVEPEEADCLPDGV